MLVLSRKQDQEVMIGDNIKITVLKTRGNTVRLGIEAPRDIKVIRGELDSEPASSDDHEENGAEFTIVFGPDSESDSESEDRQTVRFQSDQPSPRTQPRSSPQQSRSSNVINRLPNEDNAGTIRFEGRLPRVLKHNRLKEIVDRIAADQVASRTEK